MSNEYTKGVLQSMLTRSSTVYSLMLILPLTELRKSPSLFQALNIKLAKTRTWSWNLLMLKLKHLDPNSTIYWLFFFFLLLWVERNLGPFWFYFQGRCEHFSFFSFSTANNLLSCQVLKPQLLLLLGYICFSHTVLWPLPPCCIMFLWCFYRSLTWPRSSRVWPMCLAWDSWSWWRTRITASISAHLSTATPPYSLGPMMRSWYFRYSSL